MWMRVGLAGVVFVVPDLLHHLLEHQGIVSRLHFNGEYLAIQIDAAMYVRLIVGIDR